MKDNKTELELNLAVETDLILNQLDVESNERNYCDGLLEKTLNEMSVKLINDEEIQKYKPKIGEGTMGKVFKGKYKDNLVAIKQINILKEDNIDDQNFLSEILNEIKCAHLVQNEYIPKFYGLWINKGRYCLVFEFISGTTLKQKYKDLNDRQKLEVLLQLSKILEIIHSLHLIHRDIKPSNIMITEEMRVKLIDFGVSKITQKTETFTVGLSGTTRYTAPEYFQIDKNGTQSIQINNKIDIWSTGCLISEIFSGILPWKNRVGNELQLRKKLMEKTEFPIPEKDIKYVEIIEILKKCLNVSPEKRVSAEELTKLLKEKLDNL
jgi:serine/threonine protein kinase